MNLNLLLPESRAALDSRNPQEMAAAPAFGLHDAVSPVPFLDVLMAGAEAGQDGDGASAGQTGRTEGGLDQMPEHIPAFLLADHAVRTAFPLPAQETHLLPAGLARIAGAERVPAGMSAGAAVPEQMRAQSEAHVPAFREVVGYPNQPSSNTVITPREATASAAAAASTLLAEIDRARTTGSRPAESTGGELLARVTTSQTTVTAAPGAAAETSPVILSETKPTQWRDPLLAALGERIRLQVDSRSENATIRLDPPMLGRVEIAIRHEAGALQVHLTASNGDVARQLQAISETLRQDLVARQYSDVSVNVHDAAQDGRNRQRQQRESEPEVPGQALAEAGQDHAAFALQQDKG